MSVLIEVYVIIFVLLNAFNEILETDFVDIEYQMITIHCSYIALNDLALHGKKKAYSIWYIKNLGNDIAITC